MKILFRCINIFGSIEKLKILMTHFQKSNTQQYKFVAFKILLSSLTTKMKRTGLF